MWYQTCTARWRLSSQQDTGVCTGTFKLKKGQIILISIFSEIESHLAFISFSRCQWWKQQLPSSKLGHTYRNTCFETSVCRHPTDSRNMRPSMRLSILITSVLLEHTSKYTGGMPSISNSPAAQARPRNWIHTIGNQYFAWACHFVNSGIWFLQSDKSKDIGMLLSSTSRTTTLSQF